MQAAGWKDADYDTIMTISGFGPGFAYHPKKFWPQYLAPDGSGERLARATGFGWERKRYETVEEYWQALKETLWTWNEFEEWFDKWSHKVLGRHTERVAQATPRESAIETLRTVVQMTTDDPRARNPDFDGVKWGLAGLEAYAADVGDVSKSGKEDEYFYGGWLGCHAIYPQISGRASAAVYLERLGKSGVFPGVINEHVLAAAGAYGAARAAWGEYEKHLGNEETAEASDSWMVEEYRLAGAAAIRRAIEHEREAIDQVRQALAAI